MASNITDDQPCLPAPTPKLDCMFLKLKKKFYIAAEWILVRMIGGKPMSIKLIAGAEAPDFTVNNQAGEPVTLSSFRGEKNVVLYFYPKDDTPGCTKEACGFRDDIEALRAVDAEILGVSTDDEASHQKFIEKFNLPFTLLADIEGEISKSYGVYAPGKHFAQRATFIINKEGRIAKIYPHVSALGHSQEILAALQ